ncbi:MAG TPA: MBL fold metallo-hydrolase, partial [Caulobacterales bacterium]|nr:MBL fold metallo-hydrolase [Caulobacterales bacterium]
MATPIPFVREMPFAYGEVAQTSPLIRRVVANNPGPFTYFGTGVYIVGQGVVAVIDPGPDLPEHREALKRALDGEQVAAILVTHRHLDHSPAARPLADATGAPIYASGVAPRFSPDDFIAEAGDDLGFQPDAIIGDGAEVSGPDWTIEAIATPGHTSDHLCFALKQENALFTGDHVMGWSTTVVSPPDGDMDEYIASLDKIRARDFATLWPTHGPPVRDPALFIDAYKAHRLDREAQIVAQLAAGKTQIMDMVPVIYAGVDQRLYPAAA